MSAKQETAITPPSNALAAFPVFAEETRQDAMEAITENIGEIKITDLTKVTVPTGGGLAFNIETPEGPDSVKILTGIIILAPRGKVYFDKSMDEAPHSPPLCYSNDASIGTGDPFGTGTIGQHNCAVCPKNAFGTATLRSGQTEAKGKACKDTRPIYLLEPGNVLPTIVQVPPTSLKHFNKHMSRLSTLGLVYYSVVVEIGLAVEDIPAPKHSVLTFKLTENIPKPATAAVKEFRSIFEQFAKNAEPQAHAGGDGPPPDNSEEPEYQPFGEEEDPGEPYNRDPDPDR